MVIFAQILILGACFVGLISLVVVNLDNFKTLRTSRKRMATPTGETPEEMAARLERDRQRADEMERLRRDRALFDLELEQRRKVFDAKLAVARASAETENKLLLTRAATVKDTLKEELRLATERKAKARGPVVIDLDGLEVESETLGSDTPNARFFEHIDEQAANAA